MKMICKGLVNTIYFLPKGQIKPKADWHAADSPKKRTIKFVFVAFLLFTGKETNFYGAQICFWFYLTFNNLCGSYKGRF
jgi:hypothetical protein